MSAGWPDWNDNVPNDPEYYLASANASSPDPQMAIDQAELNAQGQLATQVAAVIEDRMKNMAKDVGLGDNAQIQAKTLDVTERSVSQVMKGLRIRQKKTLREGDGYRGFVLVEASRKLADEALFGAVAQDEELRTRFMASKVFQDLDAQFK